MAIQLSPPPLASKNADWNILVVDDEERVAGLSETILRREGYTVRTANSGTEALALLREQPVDLLITDMMMPQMDGMQLLAHVKELYPDTDVVVVTGYGTLEDAVEAMHRGAADFLAKPFEPRDLKRMTAACLRAQVACRDREFLTQSNAILELARILARDTEPEALPGRAVELACENFDADSGILLGWNVASESLSVLAHRGAPLSEWGEVEDVSEQARAAVEKRRVCLSADGGRGDCYAYVPLMASDLVRGVLLSLIHI